MYTCPVCGFDQLQFPIERHPICPCCYTEFGYDDARTSHDELRRRWMDNGLHWAAINVTHPPEDWNPYKQLSNLDRQVEKTGAATHTEIRYLDLTQGATVVEIPRNIQVRMFYTMSDLIGFVELSHV